MLGALTKVKSIDSLSFRIVKSLSVVHVLTNFLPAIKLKHLGLYMNQTCKWTSILETKQNLLVSLERNFTIHSECIDAGDVDFFDHEQRGKITAYKQRNMGLLNIVAL